MALEDLTGPAKFIGNLVANNPTPDDWADEGDDHVRGIKNVLRNTFPRATKDVFRELLGMIAPFTVQPPGWVLCNGQVLTEAVYPALFQNLGIAGAGNYTVPDLRGYFVRGRDFGAGIDPDGDRPGLAAQPDAITGHTHLLADPGHTHNIAEGATIGGQSQGYTTPGTNSKGAQVSAAAVTGAQVGDLNAFVTTPTAPNKILNGTFDSGANWSATGGATISGGQLHTPIGGGVTQTINGVAGRGYQISVAIDGVSTRGLIFIGTSPGGLDIFNSGYFGGAGPQTKVFSFTATAAVFYVMLYNETGAVAAMIWDNATLYEVKAPLTVYAHETRPLNVALSYCMYVGG